MQLLVRTLQCSFLKKHFFFAHENMKKHPQKMLIGPASQTAEKQKSRTTKSHLMQNCVSNQKRTSLKQSKMNSEQTLK